MAKPGFTGTRVLTTDGDQTISLEEIAEFIDWTPFFMSWELHGKYPKILTDKVVGKEATKLFNDAQEMLKKIIGDNLLTGQRDLRILACQQRR